MQQMRGFTLVELAVVMAILSIVALLTTPSMMEEINKKRADASIAETNIVIDAARSYRMKVGSWPGGATCSNALSVLKNASPPYLVGIGSFNHYASPISTSCTALTFSVDQNIIDDWDGYIANSLAGTEIVNSGSNLIRTTTGIPGSEPALDSKLSRVATGNAQLNRMETTLLLGGNNIDEVNRISAKTGAFSGSISVDQAATIAGMLSAKGESQFTGRATFNNELVLNKKVTAGQKGCTTGAIARDSSGRIMSCQANIWKGSGGVNPGPIKNVAFDTTYCPKENLFLYAHIYGSKRDSQGIEVRVDGVVRAISKADTEGYHSYESVSLIVAADECFSVHPTKYNGTNKMAWYRTL